MFLSASEDLSSVFYKKKEAHDKTSSSSENKNTASVPKIDSQVQKNYFADSEADGAEKAYKVGLDEASPSKNARIKHTIGERCFHRLNKGITIIFNQGSIVDRCIYVIFKVGQVNLKLNCLFLHS